MELAFFSILSFANEARIVLPRSICKPWLDKELLNLFCLKYGKEIFFFPSRVLMQDYTGVPAIADLAAMRDRMAEKKKEPS